MRRALGPRASFQDQDADEKDEQSEDEGNDHDKQVGGEKRIEGATFEWKAEVKEEE